MTSISAFGQLKVGAGFTPDSSFWPARSTCLVSWRWPKSRSLSKLILWLRELVYKSDRKHETKPKILLKKKEDTKSSWHSLSKLYDNSIVPASGRFRSTGVSLFVLRTQRSCWAIAFFSCVLKMVGFPNLNFRLRLLHFLL